MKIEAGQKAPDFSLYDSAKNKVTLSDLKGKQVLLLFFPQAFTSVCTKELCNVRDNIAQYNQVNAQVLGISVDSIFTLAKFKEEQQLNFPLLSDFNKEVSAGLWRLYEAWIFDMKGFPSARPLLLTKQELCNMPKCWRMLAICPILKPLRQLLAVTN